MKRTSRAVIVGPFEYISNPPPQALVKAMKECWAKRLVSTGSIRFGNLETYRAWENQVLGDPNEGEGILRVNGRPYTMGSSNAVFAWCAALPDITEERLRLLAEHGGYDCLVRVHKPQELFQRISTASAGRSLLLQCGTVSYSRDSEVSLTTLQSQPYQFNVFQKVRNFAEDREYRLAFTDAGMSHAAADDIIFEIGDCSDILEIERLQP